MTTKYMLLETPIGTGSVPSAVPKMSVMLRQEGNNTPRELRDKGILTENQYIGERYTRTNGQMIWSFYEGGPPAWWSGVGSAGVEPLFETPAFPTLIDLLPRMLGKWRNSNFNLGVSIGEGRESVEMMISRVKSIGEIAYHIRRGNLGAAVRYMGQIPKDVKKRAQKKLDFGDASGAFLEVNLGWAPLMRDISALADHVQVEGRGNVVRSSTRNTAAMTSHAHEAGASVDHELIKNDATYAMKCYVRNEPSQIERLGLTDGVSVIWALVPLSFVIDWFLPIGDTIATWHAMQSMPVSKRIDSKFIKQHGVVSCKAGKLIGGLWTTIPGRFETKQMKLTRTVFNDGLPPATDVIYEIPKTINRLPDVNLQRLATATALTHQRLKQLLPKWAR